MDHLPHVALLIESSREYGRGLLRGIIRYQKEHNPWSIFYKPRGTRDPLPTWLKTWQGDGIIARIENKQAAKSILQSQIPAIDLRFAVPNLGLHAVGIDNETVVRAALDHFLDRGFQRFAVCGLSGDHWLDIRRSLFLDLVQNTGGTCEVFAPQVRKNISWEQAQRELTRWLKKLPKPIAIFAVNDEIGQQVLDGCRRADLNVPDDIAVIGVGNDEFLCGLSVPPMTSVDINVEAIGYQAAELMARLMSGEDVPKEPILLSAGDVISRRSSDSYAFDDAELKEILRYLRDHACDGIRMEDVTEALFIERRTLERRVKAALGRSPKEEILRIQMEEACRLLARTDLPVKRIATQTGFTTSSYFSRVFRTRMGLTPLDYRDQEKRGGSEP